MTTKLKGFILPSLLLLTWEALAFFNNSMMADTTRFIVIPEPTTIFYTLIEVLTSLDIFLWIGQTIFTTLLGFSLGIILAVFFGIVIGIGKWGADYIQPTFNFLRSLPIALYVPIALVLIGSGVKLPIILSALITTLYGVIPVSRAIRMYDPEKIIFLKSRGYRVCFFSVFFILPEIIGALYTSVRITTTLALGVAVIAEMLFQSLGGIGSHIINAREASDYATLWALTFSLGMAGYLFQRLMLVLWRFALPWAKFE